MPSADFSHTFGADCSNPQSIPLARDGPGQHGRPPGVNTRLSRYCSAVYVPGLWQLGDFILCCGLVPPDPPNSVSVRRPMRLRYPAMAGRLPPGAYAPLHYRYTLRHCLAGSGTCRARHYHGKLDSPLRSRAVPGTQQGLAPDCLQRPLLRRSRFRQQVKRGDKPTARCGSLSLRSSAYRWPMLRHCPRQAPLTLRLPRAMEPTAILGTN